MHEFQNPHATNKEKIHDFIRGHFYGLLIKKKKKIINKDTMTLNLKTHCTFSLLEDMNTETRGLICSLKHFIV